MGHGSERNLKRILHVLTILFLIIQPVIDLDYLFYDQLNSLGLPRFSTVVRFIVLPALVLASFVLHEKNKKRTFLFASLYAAAFAVYFYFHTRQAQSLFPRLALTDNFRFSTWQELTYVLTLAVPYAMMYLFSNEHIDRLELKFICKFLSGIISIPILIGDLFVFGKSTYYGYTVANIFSWLSGIYDWYHPRTLASKFFFNEGNTIGILLFMILPVLYAFYLEEKDNQEKRILGILIFIQSLSMQILATRVATYGCVIMPVVMIILYLLDHWINHRNEKLAVRNFIFCMAAATLLGGMLNWTPAVQNQKVDAVNDTALLHNGMAQEGLEAMAAGKDLIPGTPEYINYYVYMFETYGINARYIQSVPSMYYTEYYSYQVDPKFWCDVTFMDVYDRVSGRQIETIFFNYKYKVLTASEKILGMGYSTFMNGSIVLEQDFKQQVYTLGYAGAVLLVLPWLLIILYGVIMFVRRRRKMFTLENMALAASVAAGVGAGWLSGHMLDQIMATSFAALIVAVLLEHVREAG